MTVLLDRRRPVESNIDRWTKLGEEMMTRMTAMDVVDELTYQNYAHNRKISPRITVARWARAYGQQTLAMEERFQKDQDMYRRIDQCREADANTYAIEE